MTTPVAYTVVAPDLPAEDRSGAIGVRLLALLSNQAERNVRWMRETTAQCGVRESEFAVSDGAGMRWPLHVLYNAATSATVFAVLARCGEPGRTMGGVSRERLVELAAILLRAVTETHPVNGGPRARGDAWWQTWNCLRMDYLFGLGAWLLWDELSPELRLLIARILEHDADRFQAVVAPAQLYDDTQAESNAWTASGLALASCMLRQHPRREVWGTKAKEFMISAYATERDVASARLVDGKSLSQWLTGPNAFPDCTVENHGFIHPIYIAAFSEKVRTAVCYRLAGETVPEAVAFNADHAFDTLMRLGLPDGNHLYLQGTDYSPRRIDSFLQACNVIPLKPDPLREAAFRRVLGAMEHMAHTRPDLNLSGDVSFPFDFGTGWALTENTLMRRLFGSPAEALPEAEVDPRLAGVHVNEPGKFALHRTARTVSSFSWHAIARSSQVMGLTMPLDADVLCHPAQGSTIGEVVADGVDSKTPLEVVAHRVQADGTGFSVAATLRRCAGKVRQDCAFVSLPDGWSVYLERRVAEQDVTILSAESGTVWLYDDLRWPFQKQPRVFRAGAGRLCPASDQAHQGNWLNVDDRMGYVALGADAFTLTRCTENYHTWRLAFSHVPAAATPRRCVAGQEIGRFALVSCPWQTVAETLGLAGAIAARGWEADQDGILAIRVGPYLVRADLAECRVAVVASGTASPPGPQSA